MRPYATHIQASISFVDSTATKAKIQSGVFKLSCNCDKPSLGITKDWIVAKIIDNTAVFTDLVLYAGHSAPDKRAQTVKDCTLVDNTPGSKTLGDKVTCVDDTWWGPSFIHERHGICNVFNPCQGFPVGAACKSDDDCEHALNKDSLTGK